MNRHPRETRLGPPTGIGWGVRTKNESVEAAVELVFIIAVKGVKGVRVGKGDNRSKGATLGRGVTCSTCVREKKGIAPGNLFAGGKSMPHATIDNGEEGSMRTEFQEFNSESRERGYALIRGGGGEKKGEKQCRLRIIGGCGKRNVHKEASTGVYGPWRKRAQVGSSEKQRD